MEAIAACSVEIAKGDQKSQLGEVDHHLSCSWSTKVNRTAARLERRLLMTLLASGAATGEAAGGVMRYCEQDAERSDWLGWCLAALMTLLFIWSMMRWQYVVMKRLAARTMMTQSPTMYRADLAQPKFQPLADAASGAWPMS